MIFDSNNPNNNYEFIKQIISLLNKYKIVCFNGEMGAGKTTLIKQICSNMNVIDIVNSPTFTIINEYTTKNNNKIFHFDLYRIKNTKELIDIGIEDYIYNNQICFIEWPELAENLIESSYIKVNIKITGNNTRTIEIKTVDQ